MHEHSYALRGITACSMLVVLSQGCGTRNESGGVSVTIESSSDREFNASVGPTFALDGRTTLEYTFDVANDTRDVVRFGTPRTSCSCTGATLARLELKPGEQTTLVVVASLVGRSDRQTFICELPETISGRTWRYRLQTVVYQPVVTAGRDLNFGLVDVGQPATAKIVVNSYSQAGGEPLLIVGVRSPGGVDARFDSGRLVEEPDGVVKRVTELLVTLTTQEDAGRKRNDLIVLLEAGASRIEHTINLYWEVRSRYSLAPKRAFFSDAMHEGATDEKLIRLSRFDGKGIVIKRMSADIRGVRVDAEIGVSSTDHKLKVTLDRRASNDSVWGDITLDVDDPIEPIIHIPVAAFRSTGVAGR